MGFALSVHAERHLSLYPLSLYVCVYVAYGQSMLICVCVCVCVCLSVCFPSGFRKC